MRYIKKTTEDGKIVKLKNHKRRAKWNKIKRKILLILFICIIIYIGLIFAPFLKVKTISCTGNTINKSSDIVKTSGINIGENLLRISTSKGEKLIIEKYPYIKSCNISRKLFSTINITIIEEEVTSYFTVNKEYYYLNENGKVISKSKTPPTNIVPILSGVKPQKYAVNNTVQFKNIKQLNELTKIIKAINGSIFKDKVTIINLSNLNNLTFTVNNNLEIILGKSDNLDYKINFLASGAYSNLGEGASGKLNVSYGTEAVYKQY